MPQAAAVKTDERLTTDENHTIVLQQQRDNQVIVQFFDSIDTVKWAKWAYKIITQAVKSKWIKEHAAHRKSANLYIVTR